MKRKMITTSLAFAGLMMLAATLAPAATINISDLSSQTPTNTYSTGTFSDSTYNDDSIDADTDVDSTADVTFAFETTIDDKEPGANRTLFEFGGGTTGFSLLLRSDGDLTLQLRDGSNNRQLGGGGTALMYAIPDALVGSSNTFVASADLDGSNATVRLFVNDTFIGAATGRVATDWAGTNNGGYFDTGGGKVLTANFNSANFNGPSGSEATADSGLRVYEDIDVVAAGPALSDEAITFSFAANVSDSNTAFGAGNYANDDNFLASGSGPQVLTDNLSGRDLVLTIEETDDANFHLNSLGLGSNADGNASWTSDDAFDLTFNHDVTLDTLWVNHGDSGNRVMEVRVVIAPGTVDEQDLGVISITNNGKTTPYAMLFGHEIADDIQIDAGTVLRLIHPGLSNDGSRLTGITVNYVPTPAAGSAGLALLAALAIRRRR